MTCRRSTRATSPAPLPELRGSMSVAPEDNAQPELNPVLKLVLELGPLLLFFAVNGFFGIFAATAVFMATSIAAIAITFLLTKKLAIMPIVTAGFVLVFGGLTLYLHNETFIKLKVTIINLMFAGILGAGLLLGRSFLKVVMGGVFELTDEGWHKLTLRWVFFFASVALLNEVIWRNVSTDSWVTFKTFGVLPLTIIFAMAQTPLIQRHEVAKDAAE